MPLLCGVWVDFDRLPVGTGGTRVWAEGLDGWLPLGKLMLEIYGTEEGTAHDRTSDRHGIAAWRACSFQVEQPGKPTFPNVLACDFPDLYVGF
jgi:hypothetical protein